MSAIEYGVVCQPPKPGTSDAITPLTADLARQLYTAGPMVTVLGALGSWKRHGIDGWLAAIGDSHTASQGM